jgi:hypothetical protein
MEATNLRRAQPGAVVQPGEHFPTLHARFKAGLLTSERYAEVLELQRRFEAGKRGAKTNALTLDEARRDPTFDRAVRARLGTIGARSAPRARGGGRPRGASQRSSAKSGDSGSDDSSSDEPEPPRRRFCAFCSRELPPGKRKYCSDLHADRDRQRRKRERDRARDLTPKIPTSADFQRMLRLEPEVRARLLARAQQGCRCNGHHLVFVEDAPRCCKCGHDRKAVAA